MHRKADQTRRVSVMTVATCTTYTYLKFVLHAFIYCVFVAGVCEHTWTRVWVHVEAQGCYQESAFHLVHWGGVSLNWTQASFMDTANLACLPAPGSLLPTFPALECSIYVGPGASSWSLTLGQQASYPWSHLSNPCMACLHFYLLKHTHEGSTQQGPTVSRIKVRGRHSQALTLPTTPIRGSL